MIMHNTIRDYIQDITLGSNRENKVIILELNEKEDD